MAQDEWKTLAFLKEYEFYETLGSRNYDEIEKTDIFQLKKKIGFATCGKPSEMPSSNNYNTGYTNEELIHIKTICDKVIEKSDYDPIHFSCTILILYHQNVLCETPIFRIGTSSGNIFIDAHARVYQSWELFLQNNKLPDCEYCFPLNGEYAAEEEFLVGFAYSPASSLFNKATSCLDTAGSVAAVAAAGVFAAGAFVSVAPVALSAAGATALCTGVYNVTRSVGSLYDRSKHEQSIGLTDQESRSAWLAIGSSAVGMTQMAALRGAQKVVESGKSLGNLSVFGLHALTASSLVFSGFGFVENLYICADKYNKGVLTKKDVFDLSCELMFLFNAIASAKATSQLVNNMNTVVAESSTSQKKLTKTQKRNLKRRAAKRRAKGLPVNVTEESSRFSAVGISGSLQLLLFEAVKAYSPRLQEILYTFQSIGHDVKCWRTNEISDTVFIRNSVRNLTKLYNKYKGEITEAAKKIVHFFQSIADDVLQFIYLLFETASDEVKSIFCTKIIDAEDDIDNLINEAEGEIANLYESLNIDCSSLSSDNDDEDESLDDDLNPETQDLLRTCKDVVDTPHFSCNDITDFVDIFDGLKFVVLSEWKSKVDNYKISVDAAKSAAGDNFNIQLFHEKLGIRGEISQHMFKETLKTATASQTIYKLKSKVKEIKSSKTSTTTGTPVWGALTEGMFYYYGPHGAGDLSHQELISVVNGVLRCTTGDEGEVILRGENYSMIEDENFMSISVSGKPNLQILVYTAAKEDNTASGMIMIVK